MSDWARVVNTTTREFMKGATVEVLRQRILLSILESRGRISFNHSGTQMQWQVRYRQAPMTGFDDADTITFSRINRWKTATLPWRGYIMADSMTKREKLINKGTEALVNVYSEIASNMMEDIEEQFGDQLYVNGDAAGNGKLFHGVESFLGAGSLLAASPVATPNTSYAGLNEALGAYGGSWSDSTKWPSGAGDAHYDFWSPTIVDYTNSYWGFTSNIWENTCIDALRFGIMHSQKNKSKRGKLDLILLDRELYRQFVGKYQLEERIHITPNEGSSGAYKMGFTNMQNFDGVDVTWEYGTPVDVGYGFSMDNLEIRSLQPELFVNEGPVFDPASLSWRFSIDCLGNLMAKSIRNFCKWKAIS